MEQLMQRKLSMKNLNKYFLSIIFLSLVTFLSASENIYEYKIRFKIKNVISLDGIKELTSKGNDTFNIVFTGKNRMLNAELNQEAEFKYLNSKVFPKYYSQKIKVPLRGVLKRPLNMTLKTKKLHQLEM